MSVEETMTLVEVSPSMIVIGIILAIFAVPSFIREMSMLSEAFRLEKSISEKRDELTVPPEMLS